ncbi:MAG: GerMN domain-containing protein [Roseburia sp.]|nr:GerMN domain-containing protein [Roseburia sp.]
MIKRYILVQQFLLLLSLLLLLTGCGQEEVSSEYHIEYLNKEKTKIIKMPYEPKADSVEELIPEFLAMLSSDSESVECRKPIPNDVEITDYSLDGALLSIYFDSDYNNMNAVEEVLCRAAVVRTMTQIDGVDCVTFYVGEAPLSDADGNIIGSMNEENIIENPGEQINSIQNTSLTLYFSNEEGNGLVRETREDVYYSGNISLEKLIMEQLLEGTEMEGAKSAIPEGTKLLTVSVVDGICYVSLDDNFRNQDYQVSEAVVIYSIVNSLTELPTISKVQISVKGDTSGVYRDSFELSQMYDRNLDYVMGKESVGTEEATEEE